MTDQKTKKRWKIKAKPSVIVFRVVNTIFLGGTALICIVLFLHILALSLSNNDATISNEVGLIPVGFTASAYKTLLRNTMFWRSFLRSVLRVLLGLVVNMLLVILCAYPLSKYSEKFAGRNFYMWFFFITALFSGGVIPLYVVINELQLMDTLWALVLPTGVTVFNIILLLNFLRQLPKEMLEAADLDGANELVKMFFIAVPCSLPSIATITLFTIVGHWNAYFDTMYYADANENLWTLQYVLKEMIESGNTLYLDGEELNSQTVGYAAIIVATIPVLFAYPFLQRFLTSGFMVGSVKE